MYISHTSSYECTYKKTDAWIHANTIQTQLIIVSLTTSSLHLVQSYLHSYNFTYYPLSQSKYSHSEFCLDYCKQSYIIAKCTKCNPLESQNLGILTIKHAFIFQERTKLFFQGPLKQCFIIKWHIYAKIYLKKLYLFCWVNDQPNIFETYIFKGDSLTFSFKYCPFELWMEYGS